VDNQQGVTMLGIFKKKAEQAACATSLLCMETLEVCVKKGFLSLEYGGYKIAYSLQNPYFEEVPKLGVSLRVNNINNTYNTYYIYNSKGLSKKFYWIVIT